jgi:hypothetical protein
MLHYTIATLAAQILDRDFYAKMCGFVCTFLPLNSTMIAQFYSSAPAVTCTNACIAKA